MPAGKRRAVTPRAHRLPLRIGLGVGVLVVGAYVVLCVVAGDRVPSGTRVDGVRIGGLRATAAERSLTRELGPRVARTVRVTGGGVDTTIDPATAGIRLDGAATVRAAGGGRDFWPAGLWRHYFGGDDREPVLAVDAGRLDATVRQLAGQVDKQTVEGAVGFDHGQATSTTPQDGRRLDRAATGDRLATAYRHGSAVRLPSTTLHPRIGADAVQQAMTSFATPAVSGPVQLVLGGHPVVAPPELFTQALTLEPQGHRLVPTLDVDALVADLEPVMSTVAGAPQPASYTIRGGRAHVVPSKVGVTFDRADLQQKFLQAVVRPAGRRTVSVKGASAPPSFTTADARKLGVHRRVAGLTTTFGYADWRNTNIARGAALLNGTVVQPGATFSFDRTIGTPTKARGFTPGYELKRGVFTPDPGAGLSQLATTLYAATFDAGLKDAGHGNDAVHNARLPLGLEVSVDHGTRDLSFTNDTSHGVFVTATSTPSSPSGDGSVTVSLWSTRTWDVTVRTGQQTAPVQPKVRHRTGATCEAAVGQPGYSVTVVRVFRRPGQSAVDHRDRTTTVYPPQNAVICGAP